MAVGVTIWHVPSFVMPQFGSSPVEAPATVAVTFWYARLFIQASGTVWSDADATTRLMELYSLVGCLVAVGLLIFDRRLRTKPPGSVGKTDPPAASLGSRV